MMMMMMMFDVTRRDSFVGSRRGRCGGADGSVAENLCCCNFLVADSALRSLIPRAVRVARYQGLLLVGLWRRTRR